MVAPEASALVDPILNGPYDIPAQHFEMGPKGPTGRTLPGRRPSESFIPIAAAIKGDDGSVQATLEFEGTVERRETNTLINAIRREVDLWRASNYPRATAISRKLMLHWADEHRENRVLFCQREAVETAIYLHEVAGREGVFQDFRKQIESFNHEHNDGLPRIALKMATGSGKTVVMAMLIAWQTLNKVASPRDPRFVKRFLVVAPGVTIRDRLRVLQPGSPGNYYAERDLVPPDLSGDLGRARLAVVNYHAFLHRESKEVSGVAANTRKLLLAHRDDNPFRETDEMVVRRVLRDLGDEKGQVMVLNDEAHHCYKDRPVGAKEQKSLELSADEKKDVKNANEDARVWFKGLQAVHRHAKISTVWDLSATPYYLKGSGYHEGFIYPWTVSDFSLMDAIESGIVKVPRLPIDDDAAGDEVAYRDLWESVGPELGKRKLASMELKDWVMPVRLEGALRSLYANYVKAYAEWETTLRAHGEPPPVFIVVCPNTSASRLVHEWVEANLPLFENPGGMTTILVDSAQLESGEPLKGDFKAMAATEIETFKGEYRRRNPGADTGKLTDADLLREVLNTVGKKGKLGEHVRCVISVAMLTEGWDANTVTHVLGIRAFRSQLLCEQVVGRGLRRRSYALGEDGRFAAEYANVYGIPFAFIPSEHEVGTPDSPTAAVEVMSLAERSQFRIEFPVVDGYRIEMPDAPLEFDPGVESRLVVGQDSIPRWTKVKGIVGEDEMAHEQLADSREQRVAFELANRLLKTYYVSDEQDERRPWLFPRLLDVSRRWISECVTVEAGYDIGRLLMAEALAEASEKLFHAIQPLEGNRRSLVLPMLRRSGVRGDTSRVDFVTRKATVDTMKSEVSHVVLDGRDGNTWEQILAGELELSADVAGYVKNDHVGFSIPYVHKGVTHQYVPDFLVRLVPQFEGDVKRHLIVEVSGGQKSPGPTKEKANTALNRWCPAVNNDGSFGRWGYVEVTTMLDVRQRLQDAIDSLYADGVVIGDVDVQDLRLEVRRGA